MTSDDARATASVGVSPAESTPAPAAYPGAGSGDDYMFASLHGNLVAHADSHRDPEADLYSLFHARSQAMNWLSGSSPDRDGEWGMNDASSEKGTEDRVAWVQVVTTRPRSEHRPAPVQPFLSCFSDAVERIGVLELNAAQVLIPAHPRAAGTSGRARLAVVGELLPATAWFCSNYPSRTISVQLTLDSGQHIGMHDVSSKLIAWCNEIKQDVVTLHDVSLSASDAVVLQPEVDSHLWAGSDHHQATYNGELCEWTLDAIGWLSAFLVDGAVQNGLSSPVVLSIRRR